MGSFSVRTSKPSGNKNFITTGKGGWNTCIQGSPTDSGANALANCVGYASGRFNEIINEARGTAKCTYKTLNCNAENFIERALAAGLKIGSTPRVGAIMCWQKGATLKSSDGAGHVAIVEKINSSSSVYTSESGYGSKAFWNQTRSNSNGKWGIGSGYSFRAFIYLPDDVQAVVDAAVKPAPAPTPTPAPAKSIDELAKEVIDGKWGNNPERKQRLTEAGYDYSAIQSRVNEMLSGNTPAPAPTPTPTPTPAPAKSHFEPGDTVTVNGVGRATSYGTGASTKRYTNKAAKVIYYKAGRKNPYALNMNNNMNGVTGWFESSAVK